ncbi:ATP-dependent Clp protease proteolytic subunit [Candidatus Brocadiaceae bacterium S225]|uniref:ATP-dependent Clp protease proteolytic subunit n=1 Tax=Candidatus Scalindua brodae TaxID=237368 RepID=A0A0B0EAY1_9BACT|nr:MAG: ATP-dependent Clp protease proteolytic subunit ClpP [Candidatus Scalindua brodae]TWU33132.1 ATP-dependent Clp protease proteolytic subunit [Candidatus Brocadiaceae bacterium S225]
MAKDNNSNNCPYTEHNSISSNRNYGNVYVPYVVEKTGYGERHYDIFSRLLKDRIIFIGSPIDDNVSNIVIAQMLFLQNDNKNQDISIYINSPGGSITAGLAIYDTMQFVHCDVATFCIGSAYSMGAVLMAAGAKGKRYSLPHTRIMLHQPWGGTTGTATDISIQAEEIMFMKKNLNEILAKHSGQSIEKIEKDFDRDFYMSSQEAKEYGIVDEVITSLDDKKKDKD